MSLHSLKSKIKPKRNRLGRGPGSGLGKTSGRGEKGAGSRSGYKRRHTYEGGQFRLFQKLPTRGFSRARFQKETHVVNLNLIDKYFADGEIVNIASLREKGLVSGSSNDVKLLAHGELTKKVQIELNKYSKSTVEKLEASGISYKTI